MFKKLLFLGIVSGILASLAGVIYNTIYHNAMQTDFSRIINIGSITGICMIACVLASCGYWVLNRFLKQNTDIVFNLVFSILSFASMISPLSMKLPLDIQFPEMFPALAIPMHFFPVLAWLVVKPLFKKDQYVRIA